MIKNLAIYSTLILFFISCKQKNNDTILSKKMTTTLIVEDKIEEKVSSKISQDIDKCIPSKLSVYLNDPDTSGTNIRKAPNGEIVTKLIIDDLNYEYFLVVTASKNGWFKIENPIEGMNTDIDIPNGEGWIHGSVISVDTRNYINQHINLLEEPEGEKVVATIKEEMIELRLKDICGEWTKIEYNQSSGWVENKWLCGNPLTTCN